jgi:prepilin-type processing-associated H-X9-DG protein
VPELTSILAARTFTAYPTTMTPMSQTKYIDGRSRLGTIAVNYAFADGATDAEG